MTNPAILGADPMDWTYDDLADELEQLAMVADLEPPRGPSLADLPSLGTLAGGEELAQLAGDLERVAELAAR
jgi:hypothetical protein